MAAAGVPVSAIEALGRRAGECNRVLEEGTGAGADFLGWVSLPSSVTETELRRVLDAADLLRAGADVVVVVGIGGSFLGARAVLEALGNPFACLRRDRSGPDVVFAGQNISEDYLYDLLEALQGRSVGVIVISKSGTTTEPAVAFRIVKAEIERRYGKAGAAERIVAITDRARGALKTLADNEGYATFVNPDDVVKAYGADTMRLYIMFIGDFEKVATWSDDAVKGCKRFLDRVWNLAEMATADKAVSEKNEPIIHKTIKKVTDDIDTLKMNTAIAALMTMVNEFYANGLTRGDFEKLLLMLSPFAPHMVEELWEQLGCAAEYGKMAMQMPWPEYDESKTVAAHTEMAVQVNGKLKGTVTVAMDSEQDAVVEAARQVEKIAKALDGMQIVKVIFVKNKLINLIVKPQ